MNVLVSPFKNPFINLALEDYFLRGGADLPLVFFYVNRPCVVLGRFQNPWTECNLPFLTQSDIWMVRRQSGGGCVFQDEGNLNYSFIYPEGMINRRKGVELIQKAFQAADIKLDISERHDLWLDGKKISGSAFKQTKDASFHHGTFLVTSDLLKLEESLRMTTLVSGTKSIPSVRSRVTRLQDYYPGMETDDVIEIISHAVAASPVTLDESLLSRPEVQKSFNELTHWDWMWGETPHFELPGNIVVHKGRVQSPVSGIFNKEAMKELLSAVELQKLFPDFSNQYESQQIIF